MAVLLLWWGLTWRMAAFGGILTALAVRVLDAPISLVSPVVGILVSLWAVRAMLRVRTLAIVLACWWAIFWRTALVGGGVFAGVTYALGTAYRSDAELLLAAAMMLPVSVWAAWGMVCVVERRTEA